MPIDRTHHYIDTPCPLCGGQQYTDGDNIFCEAQQTDAQENPYHYTLTPVEKRILKVKFGPRLQRAACTCETPECTRPATHAVTHTLLGGLRFTYHCRQHAGPDAERFAWRLWREWVWYRRME